MISSPNDKRDEDALYVRCDVCIWSCVLQLGAQWRLIFVYGFGVDVVAVKIRCSYVTVLGAEQSAILAGLN